MSSLAEKSRQNEKRCSLCNRLARTGGQTDFGWVGPECRQKVAAMPKLLAALGLEAFGAIIQVPAKKVFSDVSYGHPHEAIQRRLKPAGLTLKRIGGIDWSAERPVATLQITVDRVRKFNNAIKSHSQIRKEFADRLKEGSRRRAEKEERKARKARADAGSDTSSCWSMP